MFVKDVMTSPAITVPARTTIKDGLKMLDEHRVTSLPVTDSGGHIVGIVSEADLLRDAVHPDARAHIILRTPCQAHPESVEDVMSTVSLTVTSNSDLSEAVDLMNSTAVKSLPVVDAGIVVGVISRSDVVHLLARSDWQIRADIDDLLRDAGVECEVHSNGGVVTIDDLEDPALWRVAEVIAGSVPGVIRVEGPR